MHDVVTNKPAKKYRGRLYSSPLGRNSRVPNGTTKLSSVANEDFMATFSVICGLFRETYPQGPLGLAGWRMNGFKVRKMLHQHDVRTGDVSRLEFWLSLLSSEECRDLLSGSAQERVAVLNQGPVFKNGLSSKDFLSAVLVECVDGPGFQDVPNECGEIPIGEIRPYEHPTGIETFAAHTFMMFVAYVAGAAIVISFLVKYLSK